VLKICGTKRRILRLVQIQIKASLPFLSVDEQFESFAYSDLDEMRIHVAFLLVFFFFFFFFKKFPTDENEEASCGDAMQLKKNDEYGESV
jgi:hypothetical protein